MVISFIRKIFSNEHIPEGRKKSFDVIFISLVVFIVFVIPVFSPSWHKFLYKFFFTIIYLLAALTVSTHRSGLLKLAMMAIGLEWVTSILNLKGLNILSALFNILFFVYIVYSYVEMIVRSKNVSVRVILHAISGYLLISIVFAIIVSIIFQNDPASISFPPQVLARGATFADYLYFSIVTISTLGYGDVLPTAPYAKSLSTLICVVGQFYVAVIVALLVGKFKAGEEEK